MPQGIALLVGVQDVSPGGSGCGESVKMMKKVITKAGNGKYHIEIMTTQTKQKPTRDAILGYIEKAAEKLHSGDTFIFFFAGHGGQVQDTNNDEPNGQDDILCAYEGNIVDDELALRWKKFRRGVRIVMLSDSCHSGENYSFAPIKTNLDNALVGTNPVNAPIDNAPIVNGNKKVKQLRNAKPINFNNTSLPNDGMQAQLIHFGACSDDQQANADPAGGDFTIALTIIWEMNMGNFSGYKEFYEAIKKELPTVLKERHENNIVLQAPQYNEYGPVDAAFRNSKPFSI